MNSARGIKKCWQDHCNHSLTHSLTHYKQLLIVAIFLTFAGCIGKNNIEVTLKNPKKTTNESLNITVSNVQVINHQIIITGTNLTAVSNFKVKEGLNSANLQIESKTSTSIVANTLTSVTFAAGKVFDFILSNASAASSFTVNFSLCDSTLGTKGFNCSITPNDKEVLSYDAISGKWKPKALNGLSYQGKWDATGALPGIGALVAGDFFIVSVANAPYVVGDWLVLNNALAFERINNSTAITNVFGRTGAIVATKGDYTLTKMSDVDLTTIVPISGDVLKYDGTNWVPGVVVGGAGGGSVTSVSGTAPIIVATGTTTPAISITQSSGAANGYLSSTDWNTFNNKQATITAGTTSQYYRGDKTFQTLDSSVVTENTNLYFTNARVLDVALIGFNNALTGPVLATDTILQAFGRTQNQINSLTTGGSNYLLKNGPDTLSGPVSLTNVITASGAGDIIVNSVPLGMTSAVNKTYVDLKLPLAGGSMTGALQMNAQTEVRFADLDSSNYVSFKSPAVVAANIAWTLPATDGTSNQVLTTSGAGVLNWSTPAGGVSSVNTLTGAVTLTTTNIAEGTNLYYTNARGIASIITAPTLTVFVKIDVA